MHRSRLAGLIIDCDTDDLDKADAFWSKALGFPVKASSDPIDEHYVHLDSGALGLHVEVQRVAHPSRVHLDLVTNDLEAEVSRLERLGARRVQFVHSWWVMEAPTGQRFCVLPTQKPLEDGNPWPDEVDP